MVFVCAALVGPGRAHAAAPSLGGLSAQVQSALAQVNQVAPAAVAAVQPAVDQALAASSAAAPATPPAATAPESTPRAPESVPSAPADVIEPVLSSISAATNALATVPVPEPAPVAPQATPAAHADHAQRPLRARDSRGLTAAAARPAAIPQSLSPTSSAAPASPQVEPVGGRVERSRTPDKPAAGGGSLPQRLPPQSPIPQPDAGAPGTSGAGGSAPPLLLIGALAAGFALFSFPVHRRRLPRTAFLKPRRVVLAVWHPG
jgi:hypothetical protein